MGINCTMSFFITRPYEMVSTTVHTLTSSKGKRSWNILLILAPPDNSRVLISVPEPSMLLSKSTLNCWIILKKKVNKITQSRLFLDIVQHRRFIYGILIPHKIWHFAWMFCANFDKWNIGSVVQEKNKKRLRFTDRPIVRLGRYKTTDDQKSIHDH